ncbi:hypothetical protein EHS25_009329 [Saitozyma podzolica]|uniref:Uncharacterized protein n=1 Tax=Saitozyma podzolica TaxID=1890683 RepID=A0A427YLN1_9TREE|nr:hypothetical protein EHS25_009329 [Saitozyma podzolica]
MARETRGSAAKEPPVELATPSIKRKRRTSPSPGPAAAPTAPSLKVVLPSPSSLNVSANTNPNVSPPKPANGEPTEVEVEAGPSGTSPEGGPKRQRISLKVSAPNGSESARSRSKSPIVEDEGREGVVGEEETAVEVHALKLEGTALDRELRGALALIISQMASTLPAPLNNILGVWLPPDFTQKPENTLGHVLQQPSLTWEALVDLLHMFADNLLAPCAYPNPLPGLSLIRQPIPPLPSHLPPHAIYTFCESLRDLLLAVESGVGASRSAALERWGLMQKTPASGQAGTGGEWFTSAVDPRAIEEIKGKMKKEGKEVDEGGMLPTLAATGDNFGLATAVAVQSTIAGPSSAKTPTLSDAVIRRASLKMQRWKVAAARKKGGFGSITRPVSLPRVSGTSWTPSFAPTFDSMFAAGGVGYWDTLAAMHERSRHRSWARDSLSSAVVDGKGYFGALKVDAVEVDEVSEGGSAARRKTESETDQVNEALARNAQMIAELQGWHEARVKKGDVAWTTEREQQVAEELLASLGRLASDLPPSKLLSGPSSPGMAHSLAQRLISISAPVVRGTLDPRRPHALHDNITVRLRSPAGQTLGGTAPPSGVVPGPGSSPNRPMYGPVSAYPSSSMPRPPYASPYKPGGTPTPIRPGQGNAYFPPGAGGPVPYRPPTAMYPYSTGSPVGNTIYGRTPPPGPPQGQIPGQGMAGLSGLPGPGPSALRQSFGTAMGAPGGPGPFATAAAVAAAMGRPPMGTMPGRV